MQKDLLITIAFHYIPERVKYLYNVLDNFLNNYYAGGGINLHIIIDCNIIPGKGFETYLNTGRVEFCAHENLAHPFHLTWQHRKHIKDNIDNYKNFYHTEDDMYLPFENYLNYLENFKLLWPKCVPGFVRIEQKDGEDFISDVLEKQEWNPTNIGGKAFFKLNFPFNYHAFWIMPQKELKETMKEDFVRLSDGREFAAMYTGWELGKPCLIEIEKGYISTKCYSYHLPNNYALGSGLAGKIKPKELFFMNPNTP